MKSATGLARGVAEILIVTMVMVANADTFYVNGSCNSSRERAGTRGRRRKWRQYDDGDQVRGYTLADHVRAILRRLPAAAELLLSISSATKGAFR